MTSSSTLPIKLADGSTQELTSNCTDLSGDYAYFLPEGATPLYCFEPATFPFDPKYYVRIGHDLTTGPSWPCPYCVVIDLPRTSLVGGAWFKIGSVVVANATGDQLQLALEEAQGTKDQGYLSKFEE